LIEPTLQLDKTAIYGRYEWVQKDAIELDLSQFIDGTVPVFNIQALTLGLNRVFLRKMGFNTAIGVQGSVFMTDSTLDNLYGQYPLSGDIYIRFSPHLMHMHDISQKRTEEHSHP
jgi:hypothetical protein